MRRSHRGRGLASHHKSDVQSWWEHLQKQDADSLEKLDKGGECPARFVQGVGVQSWLYALSDWLTVLGGGGRYPELEVKMLGVSFIGRRGVRGERLVIPRFWMVALKN